MSVTANISAAFGQLSVEEKGSTITIYGINGYLVTKAITKYWATSRITNNLFSSATGRYLSFQKFFALDVYYLFEELIKQTNQYYVPRGKLKEAQKLLLKDSWLKHTQQEHLPRLNFEKLKDLLLIPQSGQMAWLRYYNTEITKYLLNGALLHGDPGIGKTFTTLATAHCLESDIVIIVCLLSTVDEVWREALIDVPTKASENKKVFKEPVSYWVASDGKAYNGEKYLIVHYEALSKLVGFAARFQNLKVTIILDESHNFNEIRSQRTAYFLDICKITKSQNIIFSSGTPIKALGSECIPLFRAIDPFFNNYVEERYKAIHGTMSRHAADIIKYRLGLVSFRIKKEELGLEKPTFYTVPIKIPNGKNYTLAAIKELMKKFIEEQVKFYQSTKEQDEAFFYDTLDAFEKDTLRSREDLERYQQYRSDLKQVIRAYKLGDLISVKEQIVACNAYEKRVIMPSLSPELKERFKDIRVVVKYVGLKIQGECLGRVLGRQRILCHVDMIEYVPYEDIIDSATKKTLIFTNYVEVVEGVQAFLTKKGYFPIAVYGKTSSDLSKLIRKFHDDPKANPASATYKSLSTGVPVTCADTLILFDQPFRDHIRNQAISRAWRNGQKDPVRGFDLMLDTGEEPNISTRTIDILKWSQEQVMALTGVQSPFEISQESPEFNVALECFEMDDPDEVARNLLPSWLTEQQIKKTSWRSW